VSELKLENVRKSFGENVVLHELTLTVGNGQILTLLGPSGCGKSTTLWSIAGLHHPDSGRISFGDRVVFDGGKIDVQPERRNCGVVFQSYAIWPHMSVYGNVAYSLKLRKVNARKRRERVQEVLELVELSGHADRFPHQLSGGQQQRVALARALACPPDLLLLDEPFSNLDAKLRDRSREWLRALQRQIGVTTVFVTHDQDEALAISDQILVMDRGRVRQVGTAREVYENPADLFVADFVGTANVLPVTILENDGSTAKVRLAGVVEPICVPYNGRTRGEASVTIRPESVEIRRGIPGAGVNVVSAQVETTSYLGDRYRYALRVGEARLTVTTNKPVDSDELTVRLPPEELRLFEPKQQAAEETVMSEIAPGDRVESASAAVRIR
jgi:iron(III) transport system ATP-binding protein